MFGKEPQLWNKEHTVLVLPWYHAYGLNTMLESVMLGMTGLVFKKYDTIIMLNRIKFYKVSSLLKALTASGGIFVENDIFNNFSVD